MATAGESNPQNESYTFEGNLLDQYDNVTYNIKLYMIPEIDILSGNIDSDNKVIIAESGVTADVSIDDLEIKTVIAPARDIKNQESFQFDFNLREYYGSGLLDQIYLASRDLGIKNYSKAPYFLELTFAGRDPSSSSPDVDLRAQKWVWPISIRQIITEVDASGSLYSVNAYHFGDLGQIAEFGTISKQITVNGATVGEAVRDLQSKLNKNVRDEAITNVTLPDEYAITVDPELAELTLVDDAETLTTAHSSRLEDDDRKSKNIELERNLNIGEAINHILSKAPGYQKLCKNTNTPSDQEVTDPANLKKIHRVFSDVKLGKFDIGRGDYTKKISYDVRIYEMSTLQTSVSESGMDGQAKVEELNSKGLLRKRYNYIYTGINDQVLNFDLKFNLGWYVNMPSEGGLFTQYASTSEGQHVTEVYYEFLRIREEIAQAKRLSDSTSIASPDNADLIQQEIDNSDLPDFEREQLERLLNASLRPRISDENQSTYAENAARNNSTSDSDSNTSVSPLNSFVSDYKLNQKTFDTVYKRFPISYLENRKSGDDEYGRYGESNRGAGRPFVSSMFKQAFGEGGDLANIEIDVKGDPYWLESKNGQEANQVVNTRLSQNSIIFSVQTADLPSETSGFVEHTTSPISGVYAIRRVDHSFSNGQFTQTLYGVKDPNIDVGDIIDKL